MGDHSNDSECAATARDVEVAREAGGIPALEAELAELLGDEMARLATDELLAGAAPPELGRGGPTEPEARERLDGAVALLDRLGWGRTWRGDLRGAEAAFRLALQLSAELGDEVRYAEALGRRAVALAELGRPRDASDHLRALEHLCRALAVDAPAAEAPAAVALAECALELGHLARVTDLARVPLESLAPGSPGWIRAAAASVWASALRGRLSEALALGWPALEAVRDDWSAPAERLRLAVGLAQVAAAELDGGLDLVIDVRLRRDDAPDPELEHWADVARAEAMLARGEWAQAWTAVRELGGSSMPAPTLRRLLPTLTAAEACLMGFREGQAASTPGATSPRALLRDAYRLAAGALRRAEGLAALEIRARRLTAEIEAERSLFNGRQALDGLEAALELGDEVAEPAETARALLVLSRLGPALGTSNHQSHLTQAVRLAAESGDERLRRHLDARRRAGEAGRELNAVLEVSRAISSILELEPLLERIMDAIVEVLGAERGFLMLFDTPQPITRPPAEQGELRLRVARNFERERIEDPEREFSGSVIDEVRRTGQPVVVNDALNDRRFSDKTSVLLLNLQSILCFPLHTKDTAYGILYVENRSLTRLFSERHIELMLPFTTQAALALENAFAYQRIQDLYEQTLSVARARERILNHVSHELKTPIAIVAGTLTVLSKRLGDDPVAARALARAERNIRRLVDIHGHMLDIYEARARRGDAEMAPLERFVLAEVVESVVARTTAAAAQRHVEVRVRVEPELVVMSHAQPLEGSLEGLLRNAIENTPDEGLIEVEGERDESGLALLRVSDRGVGITAENMDHVFEGFFHTQDTDRYSSKRPYAFDAGGKGLDLLRLRAFADLYHWDVEVVSTRCRFIPSDRDVCPGRISACAHCESRDTCLHSGGTEFRLLLPTPGHI